MLNAEKALAFDPGNPDHMLSVAQAAHRAGYYETVMWIGPILLKANSDQKSPELKKYIALRDIYKDLEQWKQAVEACHYAALLKPDDMDLSTELKNLGAQQTMKAGKYATGGSFRDSMRDAAGQQKLIDSEKDVRSMDAMVKAIKDAEAELSADPNEQGKLIKLVDALRRTEMLEYENRAIELLEDAYKRTQQFRWRASAGEIKLSQLKRQQRALLAELQKDPTNEALRKEYQQFLKEKTEEELREYQLSAENYPTENKFRYATAVALFNLRRYDEAIPIFQQSRQDPKYRTEAGILLGRAFLEAGYIDEASETMRELIESYQVRGDDKSKEMYYWYARILEHQNDMAAAIKAYSQVAQWDFNYKDVQVRIKKLRASQKAPEQANPEQKAPT
jgi:hypothetical protein